MSDASDLSSAGRPANRLANETSPYLLQHAHNPVDWHPWGPEALTRAREEDRPIFLSIGYSACHWCHVMERESFEDETIAAFLNERFVPVKVDREERPDLDEIYMKAVQAMTGQGGWPMSVFLTPTLEPFLGGTYFPPNDRHGRPGFLSVLRWVDQLWTDDRERVTKQGAALAETIRAQAAADLAGDLPEDLLDRSLQQLSSGYDPLWGGFTPAPKFPHATDLRLMLRHWLRTGKAQVLEMVTHTLDRMAGGGLYDQLAGGFARYSVDERWLVPHFEKMLYDNALLVPAFLEGYLASGDASYARVARETCDWMLDEMATPEGGLASALDADSEGEEGRYYVWTPGELAAALGDRLGARAAAWWGVTDQGNFEHGKSVLWRPDAAETVAARYDVSVEELAREMEEARARLLEVRAKRVPPGKDDKVLTAWNGLAVTALALAHQVLGEPRFLDAARRVATFCRERLRDDEGRLLATWRAGRAQHRAYLDDHAFLTEGLLTLYESDFDPSWLAAARELDELVERHFEDPEGGFFTTADDHEQLLVRMKAPYDGALPAGGSVHVLNLLRLYALTGDDAFRVRAERALASVGRAVAGHPRAFAQLLLSVDHLREDPLEVVLAGEPGAEPFEQLLARLRSTFRPQRVVARGGGRAEDEEVPLAAGKTAPEGAARAFVCRGQTCGLPATNAEELAEQLVR